MMIWRMVMLVSVSFDDVNVAETVKLILPFCQQFIDFACLICVNVVAL